MTPPPTSADRIPGPGSRFSKLWNQTAKLFRGAQTYLPRIRNRAAWLELVRLPNLLTVPGDVLAGFLLAPAAVASGGNWLRLGLAIPASLLFYAAGLIFNDVFDYAEDLRVRPERPLPSNRIAKETAVVVALVFLWIAAFFAAFFEALPVALPLILCIFLYDAGLKKHRILGPILMGACRSGNLLLGAAAAGEGGLVAWKPILAAILVGGYIAVVTHLARRETEPGSKYPPPFIGKLLGLLIPLQAMLCVLSIHRFPANLLGLALLPGMRTRRRLSSQYLPS